MEMENHKSNQSYNILILNSFLENMFWDGF